jgi:Uma2 family endonuclease
MADAGVFDGQRIELIAGELYQMPAYKNEHVVACALADRLLQAAFGKKHWVRVQAPLQLSDHSEPEPDLAVVEGGPRSYKDHPRTALLVVEISDTTLLHDQIVKSSLYARDILLDYWIVNLIDKQLEVYRKPVLDRTRKFGHRYAEVLTLKRGQSIAPLALPRKKIAVADLLP